MPRRTSSLPRPPARCPSAAKNCFRELDVDCVVDVVASKVPSWRCVKEEGIGAAEAPVLPGSRSSGATCGGRGGTVRFLCNDSK